MKIWTGKICLLLAFVVAAVGCSSREPAHEGRDARDAREGEVSVSSDRKALDVLRKDIPESTRKSNDRLAEVLNRWKIQKTSPDVLREKFGDEIRKMRADVEKRHRRQREDFQRDQQDVRKEFQDKQHERREDFLASKPKNERRQSFMDEQSVERDRFQSDQRDRRDEFEAKLKDERGAFEQEMNERWTEFRQEFPEYSRIYHEMKQDEEKKREEAVRNPKPYGGWPYKDADEGGGKNSNAPGSSSAGGLPPSDTAYDVNKGGNGWPSSDPREFEDMKKSGK